MTEEALESIAARSLPLGTFAPMCRRCLASVKGLAAHRIANFRAGTRAKSLLSISDTVQCERCLSLNGPIWSANRTLPLLLETTAPGEDHPKMRLTAELIQSSLSYLNPLKERELDLRGAYKAEKSRYYILG